MASYTISIAPNDDSGATTTVVVDTADGTSRITDVHLHAEAGLTNGRLPDINFDLLIAAFTPAPPAAVEAAAAPAQIDAAPSDVTDAPADHDDDLTPAVTDPTEPPVSAPTTSRPRRRGSRSRQAPPTATEAGTPATTRGRRKSPASTTPPSPAADAVGSVAVETRGGRPYRRKPDDLHEIYGQTNSVVAVAEHYQVPRHTAQAWVRRLSRSEQ